MPQLTRRLASRTAVVLVATALLLGVTATVPADAQDGPPGEIPTYTLRVTDGGNIDWHSYVTLQHGTLGAPFPSVVPYHGTIEATLQPQPWGDRFWFKGDFTFVVYYVGQARLSVELADGYTTASCTQGTCDVTVEGTTIDVVLRNTHGTVGAPPPGGEAAPTDEVAEEGAAPGGAEAEEVEEASEAAPVTPRFTG